MADPLDGVTTQLTADNWDELYARYGEAFSEDRWIFRGHANRAWHLETSLEREIRKHGKKLAEARGLEGGLLRRFQRQCHHYTHAVPDLGNAVEWLALMQHYGAPTRLLDWTHSFFVATHFAIDAALADARETATATVWAIDWKWLESTERLYDAFKTDRNAEKLDTFTKVFLEADHPSVIKVNPFRLNDRLVIQQGVFLIPTDIGRPFEENLANVLHGEKGHVYRLDIQVTGASQVGYLYHLHRMNITPATLFPGLDGFGRHLRSMIAVPNLLQPLPPWG